MNIFRLVTALALVLLLSGCGWQLRGQGMIPEGLDAINVRARDPKSPIVTELIQTLRSADVAVPESGDSAEYTLVITDESRDKRTATVNPNARVSEQQLTEEVEFTVVGRDGEIALPRSRVVVERVFEYDENNVIATRDEEALIRTEMRRDLVGQVLNRLRQLKEPVGETAP
ncbi:MAG: hypothetical protein CMK32_06315 [Porticoccaceae bacterium]|nr:hypothetical protein [Porticoccaceae bacterium]